MRLPSFLDAFVLVALSTGGFVACVGEDPVRPPAGVADDAGSDSSPSASDAGSGADASPQGDGATGTDAATDAGTFCTGKAVAFCADFDAVAAVDTGFAQKNVVGNALIDFATSDFTSPPRSAHFRGGTSANGNARMTTAPLVTGGKRTIVFAFRWKRKPFTFTRNAQGAEMLAVTENGVSTVSMEVGADIGWRLSSTTATGAGGPPAGFNPPADGKWLDVQLRVTFGATGSYSLTIDGVTVASKAGLKTSSDASTTTMTVGFGPTTAPYVDGEEPVIEQVIDDVTVRFE